MADPTPRLTTHVLDTAAGRPAAGVRLTVWRLVDGEEPVVVATAITDADGRTDEPLLSGSDFTPGTYEILFEVGEHFATSDSSAGSPPFLDRVPVRFHTDADSHLHVPLLVTPWSYSTYRGS